MLLENTLLTEDDITSWHYGNKSETHPNAMYYFWAAQVWEVLREQLLARGSAVAGGYIVTS